MMVAATNRHQAHAKTVELLMPLELEEPRAITAQRRLLWISAVVVALAIFWASATPVRELAIAPGELTPSGLGRVIQHLEGGVVERIMVRDGQHVEEGQPLVQLSSAIPHSDFASLAARQSALQQQKLQIEQLLAKQPSDAVQFTLTPEQARVLQVRLSARAQDEKTLAARAEQRRAELASLEREAGHLVRIMEIQGEQLRMRAKLAETGYTSRKTLLDAEAQLEQARQNVSVNLGRQEAARKALMEAESLLSAGEKDATRLWSEELAKVVNELSEVSETITKHKDRMDRLVARAPVAGVIQQVVPKVAGEVLKPGDAVAHFIPSTGTLVAELKVRPNDIPHVTVGAPAEIAINGSDPRRDGKLKGKVTFISATTYQRDQGEAFYRALVSVDARDRPIVAGMTVRGEIVTGAKSLLHYLLRPIYDGIDIAFKER